MVVVLHALMARRVFPRMYWMIFLLHPLFHLGYKWWLYLVSPPHFSFLLAFLLRFPPWLLLFLLSSIWCFTYVMLRFAFTYVFPFFSHVFPHVSLVHDFVLPAVEMADLWQLLDRFSRWYIPVLNLVKTEFQEEVPWICFCEAHCVSASPRLVRGRKGDSSPFFARFVFFSDHLGC